MFSPQTRRLGLGVNKISLFPYNKVIPRFPQAKPAIESCCRGIAGFFSQYNTKQI
jgi:hypothetical protein